MSIGTRLRKLREANNLSGEQLGEIMGVTKGMVSQWESDMGNPPTTERLLLLHKRISFSLDWLLLDEENVYSTSDPMSTADMQRLFDAAVQHTEARTWADIGRLIHESDQTMTNWKKRGIPEGKLLDVATAVKANPYWLRDGGDLPRIDVYTMSKVIYGPQGCGKTTHKAALA